MGERYGSAYDSINNFSRVQSASRELLGDGPNGTRVSEPQTPEAKSPLYNWEDDEVLPPSGVYDWSIRDPHLHPRYDQVAVRASPATAVTEATRLAGGFAGHAKMTGETASQAGKQFRLPPSELNASLGALVHPVESPPKAPQLEFHNVENLLQRLPDIHEHIKAEQAKRQQQSAQPPTPQS